MASAAAAGAAAGSWLGPPGALVGAGIGFLGDVVSGMSSAKRAKAQRNWEERMSNTAHTREVADLKNAGLNPALSAMGGRGASTPSGSPAQTPDYGRAGDRVNQGRISSAQSGLMQAETYKATQEGRSAAAQANLDEYSLGNRKFRDDLATHEGVSREAILQAEFEDISGKYAEIHAEREHAGARRADEALGYKENIRERERRETMFGLEQRAAELKHQLEQYKIPAAMVDAAINTGNWKVIMSKIRDVTGAVGDVSSSVTSAYGLGAILNSGKAAQSVMKGPYKVDPGTGEILNVPGDSPTSYKPPYRPNYRKR